MEYVLLLLQGGSIAVFLMSLGFGIEEKRWWVAMISLAVAFSI